MYFRNGHLDPLHLQLLQFYHCNLNGPNRMSCSELSEWEKTLFSEYWSGAKGTKCKSFTQIDRLSRFPLKVRVSLSPFSIGCSGNRSSLTCVIVKGETEGIINHPFRPHSAGNSVVLHHVYWRSTSFISMFRSNIYTLYKGHNVVFEAVDTVCYGLSQWLSGLFGVIQSKVCTCFLME